MPQPDSKTLKDIAKSLESLASRLQSGAASGDEAAHTMRRHAKKLRALVQ